MMRVLLALVLALAALAPTAYAAETRPLPRDEPAPAGLVGIWRQTAGGVFLTISDRQADVYHTTKFVTYKDEPASGKPLSQSYALYRLDNGGDTLVLFRHDLGERFDGFFSREEYRRASTLPAGAIVHPSFDKRFTEPQFLFDVAWHTLDEQFGFFQKRGVDWNERYRSVRSRLPADATHEQLYTALTGLLAGLGDSHTRVYWTGRTEPFRSGNAKLVDYIDEAFARQTAVTNVYRFRGDWVGRQKARVASELADGPIERAAGGKIRFGRLRGGVGYMELDMLTGFGPEGSGRVEQVATLEREMDRIIADFSGCRAVIIDLSFNQGGADIFGAVIASRFADQRRHVLSTYATGQDPSGARPLVIGPEGPGQFTGPVYVLTGNSTVSAGETLTLMLRGFPHVKQVGEPTRGDLSSILNKPLSASFELTLSNEHWIDAAGAGYEGVGIPPHIAFAVFDKKTLEDSYLAAVRRAAELAAQP